MDNGPGVFAADALKALSQTIKRTRPCHDKTCLVVVDQLGIIEIDGVLEGEKPPNARPTEQRFIYGFERSEEHTSELQSLLRISYAVFCLKKTKQNQTPYAHTYRTVQI